MPSTRPAARSTSSAMRSPHWPRARGLASAWRSDWVVSARRALTVATSLSRLSTRPCCSARSRCRLDTSCVTRASSARTSPMCCSTAALRTAICSAMVPRSSPTCCTKACCREASSREPASAWAPSRSPATLTTVSTAASTAARTVAWCSAARRWAASCSACSEARPPGPPGTSRTTTNQAPATPATKPTMTPMTSSAASMPATYGRPMTFSATPAGLEEIRRRRRHIVEKRTHHRHEHRRLTRDADVRHRRQDRQTRGRCRLQRARRGGRLVAATAQLEHRQRVLRLHTVRIADDDHRLRGYRPHLRVADVLVLDVQDLHLLDVGVERRGVRRVLHERLLDGRAGERRGADTLDALQHRRVPAVPAVGGRQRDQLVDERRMTERELQRHPAALRITHHVRALDVQGLQQRRRPGRAGLAVHLVVEAQTVDRQVTVARGLRRRHFGP